MGYARQIEELARQYAAYKKESFLFDFDDLLIRFGRLLSEDEQVRQKIAAQYQYIMVDEYQDTNLVQADIVRLLARDHGNVMAVGDDAQSVYAFRGATFRNIMEFPALFPGTRIIRLEENYRSRQPILDLTNAIIARAREKYDKKTVHPARRRTAARSTDGRHPEGTIPLCLRQDQVPAGRRHRPPPK